MIQPQTDSPDSCGLLDTGFAMPNILVQRNAILEIGGGSVEVRSGNVDWRVGGMMVDSLVGLRVSSTARCTYWPRKSWRSPRLTFRAATLDVGLRRGRNARHAERIMDDYLVLRVMTMKVASLMQKFTSWPKRSWRTPFPLSK